MRCAVVQRVQVEQVVGGEVLRKVNLLAIAFSPLVVAEKENAVIAGARSVLDLVHQRIFPVNRELKLFGDLKKGGDAPIHQVFDAH